MVPSGTILLASNRSTSREERNSWQEDAPHRGELRQAYGRVISADGRWLGLRFDAPPNALPLEGMPSDGDSGGPVLIKVHGGQQLAGLVSRKYATGELQSFRYCRYGQITYQVRISHYAGWIDQALAGNK